MKSFRKALAILLLMALLLPVAGLGESETEQDTELETETETETVSAFETLRTLMEDPQSADIPVVQGQSFQAELTDKTPDGILCQILFENKLDQRKKEIKDENGNPIQDFKIINSAVNSEEKYEAVRYAGLTMEQMLYYAYLISANYSTIQALLPYGETFSIVVKFGENILVVNDAENAAELTKTVIDAVTAFAGQ